MSMHGLDVPLLFKNLQGLSTVEETLVHSLVDSDDLSDTEEDQPGVATMDSLLDEANQVLSRFTAMDFEVDEDLDRTVVRIRDNETQRVLRQIPDEEMLELSKKMRTLQGLLFDTRP